MHANHIPLCLSQTKITHTRKPNVLLPSKLSDSSLTLIITRINLDALKAFTILSSNNWRNLMDALNPETLLDVPRKQPLWKLATQRKEQKKIKP